MSTKSGYSAPLSDDEAREFIPFLESPLDCARAEIMPRFMSGIAIDAKADATPVTEADRNAELAIRQGIAGRYPGHAVLGEEFGEKAGDGRYRWVLDPIDGTRAFVSHCFLFGTLVALERDDGNGFRPVLGAIDHPAARVRLIGHRGGTRLTLPGGSQRLARVRPCADLADATVLATAHWTTAELGYAPEIQGIIDEARLYRTWGDCFGYFSLATGGADLVLDPKLAYWDVAALLPVIEGAGGCLTSWRGGDPLREPSAVASAGGVHERVLARLHGSRPEALRA